MSLRTTLALAISLATLAGTPARAENLPQVQIKNAFPNLKFKRPVAFAWPKDGTDRLFVVEQDGRIVTFSNSADAKETSVFLDIHEKVNREGNEEGLLGLAFHPKFKENGHFFVYYSAMKPGKRRSIVSRFNVSKENPAIADPASEQIIWVSKFYIFRYNIIKLVIVIVISK